MLDLKTDINLRVFASSALFIFLITLTGSVWPDALNDFFRAIQGWLIGNTSWIYVLGVGSMLFITIYLMLSRLGDIKLGPDHSKPDFTNFSWFAMLFSAGMGIGLLFFGVAEPIMHLTSPPVGDALSVEAAKEAMKITFFHWGLHAWGVYALLAVTLAYFCYRKNLPLLPRSAFYPFLGKKIHGRIGDTIDTFAVIGTMFGVATSLGFGVSQVNAGLSYLFGIPQNAVVQVVLIAIITGFATMSVVLGLEGGIKKLSNINLVLALSLLAIVLLLGDSVYLFKSYVENTGAYLSDIVHKTFNLYAYEKKEDWIGGWTLLYWGWWVSWAPFVGMFIARISRGRSIREFMIGVLFVPTGFTFLWMTVFGNSAISMTLNQNIKDVAQAVSTNVPVALFRFLEHFPAGSILSLLAILLVVTFFVSSSDSGSLVIDTLTSGGSQEPPVWQRVFWAVMEGVVAAVLLLAGGLEALQTMTIAAAFPMLFLIIIGAIGLIRSLEEDWLHMNSVQNHTTSIQYEKAGAPWTKRLDALVSHPELDEVGKFMRGEVKPALEELKEQMLDRGLEAVLKLEDKDKIALIVKSKEVDDFRYEVRLRSFEVPDYALQDSGQYYRAEVFLLSGGQGYDVFGYSKSQIVADALTQYEKYYHYLFLSNSEQV